MQLGYGKAGWYSYDWIDNDFQTSAGRILPEHQNLSTGDRFSMMPDDGVRGESRSMSPTRSSACWRTARPAGALASIRTDDGATRLVSRWRPKFEMTPATFFFTCCPNLAPSSWNRRCCERSETESNRRSESESGQSTRETRPKAGDPDQLHGSEASEP